MQSWGGVAMASGLNRAILNQNCVDLGYFSSYLSSLIEVHD